ncbi:hypothetical protein Aeqsu_2227 [Aequorivita sublithincola DSM 14238]|uniref:Uncharacterized protein n=1 Tax=Aequorivita sublithincola (strain DSM 14238 / LMG 21431 / ACAM 643 / 9-3) TaxID=746697 RepID=I3YXG9_AEQSU|nr:hypothetical protein [Aequorivita sublithincola]AFL81687.1 hypothetical protein Aeqsu_2227 [Aequorivita sublithincola DSM 14238]
MKLKTEVYQKENNLRIGKLLKESLAVIIHFILQHYILQKEELGLSSAK